ncbi:MAG: type IX secretion system membrane protein PorP/SprF [Bacteroidales bacterium]|nr:type IX secretion system membrane protein PorP/SprF [Bacteroidales bacterium]MDD3666586.1 type IX secretion system membrane protein PorP/SprF [Bacteroidales bacterium]
MSRRVLTLLATLGLAFNVLVVKAQDPAFSQFYANPLYLNPALTGAAFAPRLILNYRNQWPSLPASFVTYNASYDQYIPNISSSFGVLFNTDRAGDGILTTTSFSGIYSYSLPVARKTFVNAGLQASFYQRKLDWYSLLFEDQIDPIQGFIKPTSERPPDNLSVSFLDFSAGLAVSHDDFLFAGLAVHHLTEPFDGFYNDNNSKMNMKITFHAGGIIDLEPRVRNRRSQTGMSLSPNILYQQQQNFKQLNIGLYFNKYPFVVGTWFRHNIENPDAFIFLLGFQHNSFRIGYSYDVTVSKLKNVTGGAHEISFGFQFDNNRFSSRRNKGPIPCPSF